MDRAPRFAGRGGVPLRARFRSRALLISAAGLALFLSGPVTPARADRMVNILIENDFLGFLDGDLSDRYYSNGLSITLRRGGLDASDFAHRFGRVLSRLEPSAGAPDPEARVWESFGVSHSFFTPDNITDPDPGPLTHPYAGYLQAFYEVTKRHGKVIDTARLSLGVVGPLAFAETVQTLWHNAVRSSRPKGWDSQLRNEPVVQISWHRKGPRLILLDASAESGGDPLDVDLRPVAAASLGNAFITGSFGLEARLGQGLGNDFGPARLGPDGATTGFIERGETPFSWFIFAGADIRTVGRNLFIEGNTFSEGTGHRLERFVHDIRTGFTLQVRDWDLSYAHVSRSEEFKAQRGRHSFGMVSITKRF